MTSLPVEVVTLVGAPMALGLGLLYGMGPCLASCLPYLGPVFLSTDGGISRSWRILLPVSLGRLTVYGGFGAVSGWWGKHFVDGAAGWSVHLVIGTAGLMVGGALLIRRRSNTRCHGGGGAAPQPLRRRDSSPADSLPIGLYLMGVGMALTPCAPQGIVLVSAALTGSAVLGAGVALAFGLGAIVGPILVYGLLVAYVGQQLRRQLGAWLSRVEWTSAALLILFGGRQLFDAGRLWWRWG